MDIDRTDKLYQQAYEMICEAFEMDSSRTSIEVINAHIDDEWLPIGFYYPAEAKLPLDSATFTVSRIEIKPQRWGNAIREPKYAHLRLENVVWCGANKAERRILVESRSLDLLVATLRYIEYCHEILADSRPHFTYIRREE